MLQLERTSERKETYSVGKGININVLDLEAPRG
jgi:hypothetical protein